MSSFPPTPEQQAIYDLTMPGMTGNLVVEAVAGSGKTTTIVGIVDRNPDESGIIVAFNSDIAKELASRLPKKEISFGSDNTLGWDAKTVHAAGKHIIDAIFPQAKLEQWKIMNIARPLVKRLNLDWKAQRKVLADLRRLVSLTKMTLTDPSNTEKLWELVRYYDLNKSLYTTRDGQTQSRAIDLLPHVMRESLRQFTELGLYDFDDMVWIPIHLNLDFPKYKKVLVDECQDLNRIQYEFAVRLLAEGGQMVFVGDRKQSIYGFTGADPRSFQNIINWSQARVMDLSVCFRCPVDVIALAQVIVPQIQPRPGAPRGETLKISRDDLPLFLKPGDMVLCRLNAPLLSACVTMLKSGVPARIKGVDFGGQLIKLIEDLAGGNKEAQINSRGMEKAIDHWSAEERESLMLLDASEASIKRIEDLADAMKVCVSMFPNAGTIGRLGANIKKMFSDDDEDSYVWFSTVHKAKGLEKKNIYIIEPKSLPLVFTNKQQQEWELEQEQNLKYVALTRAQRRLVVVHNDKDFKGYSERFFDSTLYADLVDTSEFDKFNQEELVKELIGVQSISTRISELTP